MPLFESICPKCQKVHIYRVSVADRNKAPKCKNESCQGQQTLRKIITPPMAYVQGPAAG